MFSVLPCFGNMGIVGINRTARRRLLARESGIDGAREGFTAFDNKNTSTGGFMGI